MIVGWYNLQDARDASLYLQGWVRQQRLRKQEEHMKELDKINRVVNATRVANWYRTKARDRVVIVAAIKLQSWLRMVGQLQRLLQALQEDLTAGGQVAGVGGGEAQQAAALCLQVLYRGHVATQRVERLRKQEPRRSKRKLRKVKAATSVQAVYRGHAVRRELRARAALQLPELA
jgi:methyl coenzyme M reductase subunit C-like uncharacterized protein (methanogenesis marker protein 7)